MNTKLWNRIAWSMLMLTASACTSDPSPRPATNDGETAAAEVSYSSGESRYSFNDPDVSFVLSDELREISALTVLPDGRLAAVQDERGVLYVLNVETGAIESRHRFGEPGDYEGVEFVDGRVFVLRSNGSLVEISDWSGDMPAAREHETDLKGKNDTEGLAFDSARNRLLIACKEDPGDGVPEDYKAVYAFDVGSGELSSEPVFRIDVEAVEQQADAKGKFKPSALAVHPLTGELYVLSSILKSVVVLGTEGSIRNVWNLPDAAFEQPEGLAFLPDGTLFISSEGDKEAAMLYRFGYEG